MTKVYHINRFEDRVECIKKFKTELEAKEFIEKAHDEQIRIFGKVIDEYFI